MLCYRLISIEWLKILTRCDDKGIDVWWIQPRGTGIEPASWTLSVPTQTALAPTSRKTNVHVLRGKNHANLKIICYNTSNPTDPIFAKSWIFFFFLICDELCTLIMPFSKMCEESRPTDPLNIGPVSGNLSFIFFSLIAIQNTIDCLWPFSAVEYPLKRFFLLKRFKVRRYVWC